MRPTSNDAKTTLPESPQLVPRDKAIVGTTIKLQHLLGTANSLLWRNTGRKRMLSRWTKSSWAHWVSQSISSWSWQACLLRVLSMPRLAKLQIFSCWQALATTVGMGLLLLDICTTLATMSMCVHQFLVIHFSHQQEIFIILV
jgi:hypothetical protein